MVVHMSKSYGAVVAHVNASNRDSWNEFRRVADEIGVPYSRALEQAARLWLENRRAPAPVIPQPAAAPAQVPVIPPVFPSTAPPQSRDPFAGPQPGAGA
jgi:hypothetical protein